MKQVSIGAKDQGVSKTFFLFFLSPGLQHGQAAERSLHRVFLPAVGEQRAGHLPRGHAGLRLQEQQEREAQQILPGHQEDRPQSDGPARGSDGL